MTVFGQRVLPPTYTSTRRCWILDRVVSTCRSKNAGDCLSLNGTWKNWNTPWSLRMAVLLRTALSISVFQHPLLQSDVKKRVASLSSSFAFVHPLFRQYIPFGIRVKLSLAGTETRLSVFFWEKHYNSCRTRHPGLDDGFLSIMPVYRLFCFSAIIVVQYAC